MCLARTFNSKIRTLINIKHNFVIKRNMMASGSTLSLPETIAQKKIYAVIFNNLRLNPLNQEKLLSLIELSSVNLKVFPTVKIASHTDTLFWNDVIAAYNASILKKHSFFNRGKLYTLVTPEYDPTKGDTGNNIQAIANTKQKNPDYFYKYIINEDGQLNFERYFDLKAKSLKPMSGHILIKSNLDDAEDTINDLMYQQKEIFKHMAPEFKDISDFISSLIDNQSISWIEKNTQLHNFYLSNLHRLLKGQTPSMVFHHEPIYKYVHMPSKQYDSIPTNTKSCSSLQKTQDSIFEILKNQCNITMENFKHSHGISQEIKTKLLLETIQEFLTS